MQQSVIVVVGKVVEEIKQEHCCTGASTPRALHSTKVVAEKIDEMTSCLTGNDIEMQRTKEEV